MSLGLATPRRRRRPSLTPMIDVVFLLLVFFMLVARFAAEGELPLLAGGAGAGWEGPPRLVEVLPDGLRLNGVAMSAAEVAAGLAALGAGPQDAVVLRARDGASLQQLVAAMEVLGAAGHARLVLVE